MQIHIYVCVTHIHVHVLYTEMSLSLSSPDEISSLVACYADYSMFAQIHSNANLTIHNGTDGSVMAWVKVMTANIDLNAVPPLEVLAKWDI
jgi:hypothetical protein